VEVERTALPEVLLIKPRVFRDARGHFLEAFHQARYREIGIDLPFVQDNVSRSGQGTLRGIHYQAKHSQGKLVSVTRGKVFDVAVDVRNGSPTFGKWVAAMLTDENHHQMYVPPGFAHGFCVLSETADFAYKCTDFYHPEDEVILAWNDPTVGIDWPIDKPILSEKDRTQGLSLSEFTSATQSN